MILLRELALSLTLLLILLFAGSFVLTVSDARYYLQEQLDSHAQDTATSLGVAIASTGVDNVATVDSMIDAVFDHGYYRRPEAFSGRRSVSSFTVFVPACGMSENRRIIELLFRVLASMEFFSTAEGSNCLLIASVTHHGLCKPEFLLDHGDKQLLELEAQVKNCWDVSDVSGETVYPYMRWSDKQ